MSKVEIKDLTKMYTLKAGLLKQLSGKADRVSAVSHLSLTVKQGEIVGLVGESGCGKTTLGKMIVRLEMPTSGSISLDGENIDDLKGKKLQEFRRKVQMIFQDPYDSLDPKMTIREIIAEPLRYLHLAKDEEEITQKVSKMLELVELSPADMYINRYPHRLSGGQRQRVAIARALIVEPEFLVADEPVSMLDVSIRAGVLNLLQKLNRERGIGVLLITHDLATARFLCHRIVVMYLGMIVEISDPQQLVDSPMHPYSKLLISSAPDLFAKTDDRVELSGRQITNAVAPPKGCRFAPRCPYASEICRRDIPKLTEESPGHFVACFHKMNKQEEMEQ